MYQMLPLILSCLPNFFGKIAYKVRLLVNFVMITIVNRKIKFCIDPIAIGYDGFDIFRFIGCLSLNLA